MNRNLYLAAGGLALAAALGAAMPGHAADVPQAAPAPMPEAEYVPPAPAQWAGFYFGVLGSYLDGEVNTTVTDPEVDGFGIGAIAGYNAQFDNWVLGVEGDWSWTNADGSSGPVAAEFNWIGSARARAGYAFDNVLVFGAGGLAFADVDASAGGFSDSATHLGWTIGAGIEAMLTDNVAGRLEYSYYDFDSENYTLGAPVSADAQLHAIRAGLTYKFGY